MTSAQRFRLARSASTRLMTAGAIARGLVRGRELLVGMAHLTAASRKVLLPGERLGRLSLVSWTFALSTSHFCFQRQIILRWAPHLLATVWGGRDCRMSNRMAVVLSL